jgi:formylglycine-generating enzyme required for sulfatase activity
MVYLGYDDLLQRFVAVKVPHQRLLSRPDAASAYLAEARSVAALDHPNIVPVYDVGSDPECPCYVVSKFIDGTTLAARNRAARLPMSDAVELVAVVADALHHAHTRGLVHRDVKPGNILLGVSGTPYVADFGLALREQDVGKGPKYAGTPAYMSPEQARGEGHRVDGRSDIFSLGTVLYELLTGRRPFAGDTEAELLEQIGRAEPRPPRQTIDHIPAAVERVCLRALAKRATDRYPTAQDMADDLRHAVGDLILPPGAPVVETVTDPGARHPASDAHWAAVVPKGLRAFDAADADFYLDLIPGPRDRTGLPDVIRFWKNRIEETDADDTFPVGLMYGPSGCGKSSIVKAGLLPRLLPRVRPIYLEAAADLEVRLQRRLVRMYPSLWGPGGLADAMADVRRGDVGEDGEKTLIVIDQFEQWLHTHPAGAGSEFTRALRQCDGGRLQCLLLVRDDYWMAASRLMRDLEIPVAEGRNAAAVDLLPSAHARRVLAAFGRAYQAMPDGGRPLSADQEAFLDQAVAQLSRGGWVIPVRLALFADLLRARPWTPGTLRAVGGATGVGVTFLEENFTPPAAPPGRRTHGKAARAVLEALVPAPGTDIRGHVRGRGELMEAAGYAQAPERFEDLIRILTADTRLLTPVAPEDGDKVVGQAAAEPPADEGFQLTHDYMVPAVREWLGRAKRSTRRGRAELNLAERAILWQARPERRQLPSLTESLAIWLFTRRRQWTDAQRRMMRAAARRHIGVAAAVFVGIAVISWAGLAVRDRVTHDEAVVRADGLVRRLLDANVTEVPRAIAELDGHRRWADPLLERELADPATRADRRLRARLALLPVDPHQVEPLRDVLLEAAPDEFPVIRNALFPHRTALVPALWALATTVDADPDRRFRAAAALAAFDPDGPGWAIIAPWVTGQLVAQPSLLLPRWAEALRPARTHLGNALAARIAARPSSPVVAELLADFAADRPDVLAAALADSAPDQFPALFSPLVTRPTDAIPVLDAVYDQAAGPTPNVTASRRANLAIALLRLGRGNRLWTLCPSGPNPRARSFAIDRIGRLGCDPDAVVTQITVEQDPTVRAALWLALGGFNERTLPRSRREEIGLRLLAAYRTDSNAAVHAAAWWLLGQWGARPPESLSADRDAGGTRGWYTNSLGQTLVRIRGPIDFVMGAPPDEPGTQPSFEKPHTVRMRYGYDIGMTEVTVGEYRRLLEIRRRAGKPVASHPAERPDLDPAIPVTRLTWYEAAAFCNWLSEVEGLDESEWCYRPNSDGNYAAGMTIVANYHQKKGYRLPTEAEWEYACRAGSHASRCYGDADELLPRYAWFALNSNGLPARVASLLPNAFGLFDMHGNASEWCQNPMREYGGRPVIEAADEEVQDHVFRVSRSGKPISYAASIRSARRYGDRPTLEDGGGLRVVRSAE